MEPADNLGHSSRSEEPQLEQDEDLMFLWASSLPPPEGQISPLEGPLATMTATDAGQLLSHFSPSSITLDDDTSFHASEEDIQQMMLSLQEPNPLMALHGLSNTPTNGGPAARSHADAVTPEVQLGTSTTTGSQGTLIPAVPQDQEVDILSRASTRPRANKRRGLSNRLQDGPGKLFGMGMDTIRQLVRYIGKMMEEKRHRLKIWQHFCCSGCKCHGTITCKYCSTVMRQPSTIQLLIRHLENCERYNNIHLLLASSGASKETQWSFHQALQIKEIAENPNGESELIETDNSNCATSAQVDTQGTNAVNDWEQLLMEDNQGAIVSSSPGCWYFGAVFIMFYIFDEPDSWWDLMTRLFDSSCCSSTTESTHDDFRLKFFDSKKTGSRIVHMPSSAAWALDSENPYDHAGVLLRTDTDTIGRPYLLMGIRRKDGQSSLDFGCANPWLGVISTLGSLGFRKEFAREFVIYVLGWVDGCNLRLRSPGSSNKGKRIVEQGGASSGKRRRESKVWEHFKKVEALGSMPTMARCNYCPSVLQADSKKHGTTHLARHVKQLHPEKLAESLL